MPGAASMESFHSQQYQCLSSKAVMHAGQAPSQQCTAFRTMLLFDPHAVPSETPPGLTVMQPAPAQSAILHLTMKVRSCMGLALPGNTVP